MRFAALFAAALALAACSGSEPPEYGKARQAVAAKFGYPGSVEFQHLKLGQFMPQVCGEVRGRLVDGTMTDFRRFNWQPQNGAIVEGLDVASMPGDPDFDERMAHVNDSLVSFGCTE